MPGEALTHVAEREDGHVGSLVMSGGRVSSRVTKYRDIEF
jgi:hypothetical protein